MTDRRAAAWVVVALLVWSLPARAQNWWDSEPVTPASLQVLHRWVDAVTTHVPGRPDSGARDMAAMTYSMRRELSPAYALFTRVLRSERISISHEIEKSVVAFAEGVRNNPGPLTFLRRAAVLHADAVVFARRFPTPPDEAPPIARGAWPGDLRRNSLPDLPPLLTYERFPLTRDGQVVGTTASNWNLPFARSLLAMLLQKSESAGDRVFVADWYHAVSAYLFSKGMNGDATSHLKQSARVLPDDARALFDRATYAETFGLPIYQAVSNPGIPSEDKTNTEAEELYRRVLEVDPAYVEARVRLARLLHRRGRSDDAALEIDRALDAHPTAVVGFYARIVAGRIATARGRHADALQHYRIASDFFQHAQSALLGASHAALMGADLPDTLTPLEHLNAESDTADPWWDYSLGAGRDAAGLLDALWTRVEK